MNSPCISVIIPCYNMEAYLMECLDSVLNQSLWEIELLCIDDGSTDLTGSILDAASEKDRRLRVFHQSNQGVSAARNLGIRAAMGKYIAFMDPDDFYPSRNTLELLYTKAEKNNAWICGGSFSSYNNKTGRITTCYTGDSLKNSFAKEGYISYREYQFDFGYHRFLYNRSFLLENQLFFPPYMRFQDPPFFVRAMIAAERFYAVPEVVYRYRVGIQDKPTSWPAAKLHDMMRGYLDNLNLSLEYGLRELHALTVRRFESDAVYEPVMKSLRENDEITAQLLKQINASVNSVWLTEAGMCKRSEPEYMLRAYREFLTGEQTKAGNSGFTKTAQKIMRIVDCCRERGISYIVRLVLEHIK